MNLFILGFPVTSLCLTRHLLHSILFSHNGYCLFFYISWGSETVFWNYLWWSFDPLVMHFFHYLCYLFFIFIHPGMKINLLRPSVCEHIACTVCSEPCSICTGYRFFDLQLEGKMTCPRADSASNRKAADAALCSEMGSPPSHHLLTPTACSANQRTHKGSSSSDTLLSGLSLCPRSLFWLDLRARV